MSTLPADMTVIEITESGGPEVLKPATRPVPEAGKGEVLIKVAAAGVNRPDVLQRQGGYPPPPGASDIPGLEIAGEVVALGEGVTDVAVGDKVCSLVTGGGYAEYCVAPAPQCLPVPDGLSITEAGAVPETFFTVWNNVFDRCGLSPGESFLVHGGSSGIGTTAIQMAKAFGAKVFATAGSPEKCKACEDLGADHAINYRDEDFVAVAKAETDGGLDVILDMVGGDYVQKNIKALRPEGRLCYIAFLGGSKTEVDLLPVMLKRLTITGSTLRASSVPFKAAIAANLREKVWPLVAKGQIRPVMHAEFPLEKAAEAHALMESSQHIGKIVLTVG
ncbi:MAG: NAD(P)H-quinone oxidoreductase [Rhodospirillales bacterium]